MPAPRIGCWSAGTTVRRAVLPLLLVAAAACAPDPAAEEARVLQDLQQFRTAKDAAFLTAESPVPPDRRSSLLPLEYFPSSIDYRVPAILRPYPDRPEIEMPTSTGQLRKMVRVGRLEFTLKGQPLSLSAFIDAGARDFNRLFVPFTDLTSGTETYPAGRYLDLDRTATGIYIIDFNRAYHPYCYYNPVYDCPYPPRENRLEVPIRAGEKMRAL